MSLSNGRVKRRSKSFGSYIGIHRWANILGSYVYGIEGWYGRMVWIVQKGTRVYDKGNAEGTVL
jgi:hypothetical protein